MISNLFFMRVMVLIFAGLLLVMTVHNGLRMVELFNSPKKNYLLQVEVPDLTPENSPGRINQLTSLHLFKTPAKITQVARESRLNIRLMGVISSSLDGQARIIIEHPSREQKYYKQGDEIIPNVVLEAIYKDHIFVKNHNSIETLQLHHYKK